MRKRLSVLTLILGFGLVLQPCFGLRPSPDARTPKQASSQAEQDLAELIRQRDMAKREADRRIREKEKAAKERADKVIVRVHAGGANPTSREPEVIMTTEIPKEDLVKKNLSDLRRQARESQIAYARSRGDDSFVERASTALASNPEQTSSDNAVSTVVLLGGLGLIGLWYVRQQNTV